MFNPKISPLQVLALGGEKCLSIGTLQSLIDVTMFSRLRKLQNLYGITEISCWASVYNIRLYENELQNGFVAPLGESIARTDIFLKNFEDQKIEKIPPRHGNEIEGHILIGSTVRICAIQQDNTFLDPLMVHFEGTTYYCRATGDLGRWDPEFGLQYLQRLDRTVKFNGMRFNLCSIEKMALESGLVERAECVCYEEKIYLCVVFSNKNGSEEELVAKIGSRVPLLFMPCEIISLTTLPLTRNGKLDIKMVLEEGKCHSLKYKGRNVNLMDVPMDPQNIVTLITPIWTACTKTNEEPIDSSRNFLESGGTSITARQFCERVFSCFKCRGSSIQQRNEKTLLNTLFGGSFAQVITLLTSIASESYAVNSVLCSGMALKLDTFTQSVPLEGLAFTSLPIGNNRDQSHDFNPFVEWKCGEKFDQSSSFALPLPLQVGKTMEVRMGQCVDASVTFLTSSPDCIGAIGYIGSYAGILKAISTKSIITDELETSRVSHLLWCRKFQESISADVLVLQTRCEVVVALHDGSLFKLDAFTGQTIGLLECQGAIRASPVSNKEEKLLAVVDDMGSLYCINAISFSVIWEHTDNKLMSLYSPCFSSKFIIGVGANTLKMFSQQDGTLVHEINVLGLKLSSVISTQLKRREILLYHSTKDHMVVARNVKTCACNQMWTYYIFPEESGEKQPEKLTLLPHACQMEIICIHESGKMEILDCASGKLLRTVNLKTSRLVAKPRLVCCTEKCYICYLGISENVGSLTLSSLSGNLEDSYSVEVECWSDEENFSQIASFENMFFIGGRDDTVRIIELNRK